MIGSTLKKTGFKNKRVGIRPSKSWFWLPLLLGTAALLLWAKAADWPGPIVATDVNQHRANIAAPTPGLTSQIRQTFVPQRDGLTAIELLLVRHDETPNSGHINLQLLDEAGKTVVVRTLANAAVAHNQSYTLTFPAQSDSAGQQYTLLIGGSANNYVSAWAYDLDVYEGGALTVVGGESRAQDLRFVTRYQLSATAAAGSLLQMAKSDGPLLLLALALVFMPGCLSLLVDPGMGRHWDPAAWWGVALAAGLSIWALLWLWLTALNGHWTGGLLWFVLIVGWLAVAALLGLRLYRHSRPARPKLQARQASWHHGALIALLLLGLAVRWLAVRDLSFPPWVDSSRHALITTVMAEKGQTIGDYSPFLAVDQSPYHYGFHALSASLLQMTGVELPGLLLALGVLLNALVPLAIYAGAYLFTRRRGVALLAAFLVAIPFFFPGYYATWGRLTQLTAVILLPVAIALTWTLVRGARGHRSHWWLVAVLAAGLFLIHFRIFLLYVVFVLMVWLLSLGRNWRWLLMATLLSLLLVSPRLASLLPNAAQLPALSGSPGYNDFPSGYVDVGWERAFLWLGLVSLILAIVAVWRGRSRALLPLFLAAWAGLVAILLSGNRLGLPETWIINLNSAYITFFIPLSLLLAITAGWLTRWLSRRNSLVQVVGRTAFGLALVAAMLFGLRQQITILNSQTILAYPQDLDGLNWLSRNVERSAKVAVNSWLWLGEIWAGGDGGAWMVPLTGRTSTTPPVDYTYSPSLADQVMEFNQAASQVEDWSDPAVAAWLREEGITHLYVGARGGFLDPSLLAQNPEFRLFYQRDGVFIFGVE